MQTVKTAFQANARRDLWQRAIRKPVPVDPLLEIYEEDAVLQSVGPNAADAKSAVRCETCCLCFIPCCWPVMLCSGTCCQVCCMSEQKLNDYAAGTRLFLRENTLLFEVRKGSPNQLVTFCVQDPTSSPGGQIESEARIVLDLMHDEVTLEKTTMSSSCGNGVETLVVRFKGIPVGFVDFPTDVDAFLQHVQDQRNALNANSSAKSKAIHPTKREIHWAILDYQSFLMTGNIPMREVQNTNSANGTTSTSQVLDKAQMEFMGRNVYSQLETKLNVLNHQLSAPQSADMVRDESVFRIKTLIETALRRTSKRYALFVSYHQAESAAVNTIVDHLITAGVPADCMFFDKMSLVDIRGLSAAIKETLVVLQIQSAELYFRPYCLIEAFEALTCNVNVLPVALDSYNYGIAAGLLNSPEFSSALESKNPGAAGTLRNAGYDPNEVGRKLGEEFPNLRSYEYLASKNKNVRDAQLKDITEALVKRIEVVAGL